MLKSLECPVCLTLPNGEVHQCNEGHTVCIDCWRRINPRACPECRQLLPQSNRCRAAERAIAALDTTCEHCGETVTRGQMEEHLHACPQRWSTCAAATAGCQWEGWASERAAHEKACPFAICLRMVEPLRSECEQLRAENERLQRRVTALGGRGRRGSLYRGDAEEVAAATGGQDFEAMANGPPPSDAEVEEMGLAEVVAALRAHLAVARVAEEALSRLEALSEPPGSEQAAAEAGAIEAVVDAMQAQAQVRNLQAHGCAVLRNVCVGDDAAASARQLQITNAGGLEALVGAMEAHAQYDVHEAGCGALLIMCGRSASVAARALQAGGRRAAAAAMQAHPDNEDVQADGQALLDLLAG